jgi:hypothetical protein
MTDPIRAALEKAWLEAPLFLVTLPSGTRRSSLSLEETAKVIHDFLRALPDLSVCPRLTCNYNGSGDSSATLAQAVLAAAKDQTNE